MAEHARLCSPSGAEGWFACAGRSVMEREFPDSDTDYSSDGTARHAVVAMALDKGQRYGVAFAQVSISVGEEIDVGNGKVVLYKPEWVEEDQDYVDTVRSLAEGGELFVERRVNFETYTGVKGDSFGTADAIVLSPIGDPSVPTSTPFGYELIVVDRKTGYVEVEVERNKQLMLYALGALAEFGMVYDIVRVRLVIHQRKATEWDCSIDELLQFGAEAKEKAQLVQDAAAEHGVIEPATWQRIYLNPSPSEDACRYCKAMTTCPNYTAMVESTTGADFEVLKEPVAPPRFMGSHGDDDEELAHKMSLVGAIEDWCKAVRAEVERRLLAGVPVPGFKLVLGKAGNRKWADEAQAEQMLKTFRLKQEEMYDFTLISPTAAEKLSKAEVIGKRQWPKLQTLITRSEPKPSVAPITDKRDAYVPPNAADDFAPIPESQPQEAEAGLELC